MFSAADVPLLAGFSSIYSYWSFFIVAQLHDYDHREYYFRMVFLGTEKPLTAALIHRGEENPTLCVRHGPVAVLEDWRNSWLCIRVLLRIQWKGIWEYASPQMVPKAANQKNQPAICMPIVGTSGDILSV